MEFNHRTKGVCAPKVQFEIEDNIVKNVVFHGGCNGNAKAMAVLVEGMNADQVVLKLSGIRCGGKSTSCADQFAQGITLALEKENSKK